MILLVASVHRRPRSARFDGRVVSAEEAEQFAAARGLLFVECDHALGCVWPCHAP
jgi:hypothetical protein